MVFRLQSTLFAVVAALLFPTLGAAASPWLEVNRALVDQHIVPRYEQLAAATARLDERSRVLCAAPDPERLVAVREQFQLTMDAWMGVQHVRFGPVDLYLRYNRFQLWPDKHNTAERQLSKALADQDHSQLTEDKFPFASVALQGLSAYERLAFDGADDIARFGAAGQPGYPCELLEAVAHNLSRMAADIVQEWTAAKPSYREIVLEAEQGNSYFASSEEFSARMLNNLYTALQFIVDQKLMLPMGSGPADANPRRAESWRSGRSLRNIILNLEAAESLYMTGYSALLAADKEKSELDRDIRRSFAQALQAARAIPVSLDQALQTPARRPSLERLLAATSELKRLLGGSLPTALGLSLGFNSLDGD